MKIKISLPDGTQRTLPDHAKCYCVTRHTPQPFHPLPYALPDGTELWLCPTTHHAATTLFKMYKKLGTCPNYRLEQKFTYFVRSLVKEHWYQHAQLQEDKEVQDEGMEEYRKEIEADKEHIALVNKIKERYL